MSDEPRVQELLEKLLASDDTRFVLSGIVNRMDRAYVSEADCGEIRLIYRLTRLNGQTADDASASPRLPMTLNVVLKAKGNRPGSNGKPLTCAEIARRWLAVNAICAASRRISLCFTLC